MPLFNLRKQILNFIFNIQSILLPTLSFNHIVEEMPHLSPSSWSQLIQGTLTDLSGEGWQRERRLGHLIPPVHQDHSGIGLLLPKAPSLGSESGLGRGQSRMMALPSDTASGSGLMCSRFLARRGDFLVVSACCLTILWWREVNQASKNTFNHVSLK